MPLVDFAVKVVKLFVAFALLYNMYTPPTTNVRHGFIVIASEEKPQTQSYVIFFL